MVMKADVDFKIYGKMLSFCSALTSMMIKYKQVGLHLCHSLSIIMWRVTKMVEKWMR